MEYQETMNLDIEIIASTSQKNWRSIYEVIHDDYFKVVKLLPTQFLDHYLKMNIKTYQMRSKQPLKYGFGSRVLCISGYDTHKELRLYKRKR